MKERNPHWISSVPVIIHIPMFGIRINTAAPCPVHSIGIKIAYDNTQQPVISLSFHVFKETPYLCSKAFFFLNTARIAIPNALMTNKEVNRPTFV